MEDIDNYPLIKNHWEPDFYCSNCAKGFYTLEGLEWHKTQDCEYLKRPKKSDWFWRFATVVFSMVIGLGFIFLFIGLHLFFSTFKNQLKGELDWRINFFAFFNLWLWFVIIMLIFN